MYSQNCDQPAIATSRVNYFYRLCLKFYWRHLLSQLSSRITQFSSLLPLYPFTIVSLIMPSKRGRAATEQEDAESAERSNFTVAQTRCLINVHLKDLQEDFLVCGSKITYWNKVKTAMIETFPDFDKTAEQVREKWRNLEKTYRAKKKAAEKSGAGKVTWPFFHQIDAEMGDRNDITLDGMTTIGGENNAMGLPDFGDELMNDPSQDWPIDRAESADDNGKDKGRGRKRMKTGKDEVLVRVDQLIASTDEAMKTLSKLADNQEKLVEQNQQSVTASQGIAESQKKIADSFASIAVLFSNRG